MSAPPLKDSKCLAYAAYSTGAVTVYNFRGMGRISDTELI